MKVVDIELTTSPSAEDAETLSQGLIGFNRQTASNLEPVEAAMPLSVFARDDDGEIVGGLRAVCFWNTLHIEALWLAEEARGKGTGSALVARAEQFAIDQGFDLALLETTDWQARPFWEKQGYAVVAAIPEYPRGHEMYILTKRLVA